MKMTKGKMKMDKREEFKKLAEPLMKWLLENGTPHDKIIIDNMNAEFVSGQLGIASEYNKKIQKTHSG